MARVNSPITSTVWANPSYEAGEATALRRQITDTKAAKTMQPPRRVVPPLTRPKQVGGRTF